METKAARLALGASRCLRASRESAIYRISQLRPSANRVKLAARILTRDTRGKTCPRSLGRRAWLNLRAVYMQFNRVLYQCAREFIRLTRAGRHGE